MQIRNIHLSNFDHIEDASLDLSDPGIYYVTGSRETPEGTFCNRAGKSTMLAGIWWAITGQAVDRKLSEVVGPFGDSARSTVELYDGRSIVISRSRTKGGQPGLKVKIDGETINQKGMSASWVEDALAKELGIDFGVARYGHYMTPPSVNYSMSAAVSKPFIWAPADRQQEAIARLYGKEDIEKVRKKVEENAGLESKALQTAENEHAQAEAAAAELERSLNAIEQSKAKVKKKLKEAKGWDGGDREALTEEHEKLQSALRHYDAQKKDHQAHLREFVKALRKVEGEVNLKQDLLRDLTRKLEGAQHEARANEKAAKKIKLDGSRLKKAVTRTKRCPECGQDIQDKDVVAKLKKAYNQLVKLYKSTKTKQTQLDERVKEFSIEVKGAEATVGALQEELHLKRTTVDGHEQGLQHVENSRQKAQEALEGVRTRLEALSNGPAMVERLQGELKALITQKKAVAERLEAAFDRVAKSSIAVEEHEQALNDWKFWKTGARDIRLRAFSSVADNLTEASRVVLAELVGDSMDINFEVDVSEDGRDRLLVQGREDDGDWREAALGSTGFLEMLEFASFEGFCAFADLELGIRLIDEPLGHVDPRIVAKAVRMLSERAHEKRQAVLFVTHQPADALPSDARIIHVKYVDEKIEVS